ncbi:hypothetical protein [Caldivirga maquilingensis]|uniref:hypothetical protein n=1 Tax=Caldivirga maquilingensis TaxID=76887 RepID=UPI00064F7FBC|nr:hypothetical protein [Caldivirga maquilingensis]
MDSEIKGIVVGAAIAAIIAILYIVLFIANLVEGFITWFSNVTGINIPANVNFMNPVISTFTTGIMFVIILGAFVIGAIVLALIYKHGQY